MRLLRCSSSSVCVAAFAGVFVTVLACAPTPRTEDVSSDGLDAAAAMAGTGSGGARMGGKGGAGGAGGKGGFAGATTNDADAGSESDARGLADGSVTSDAAAKMDTAAKVDAGVLPVLTGEPQDCNAPAVAAADMLADFEAGTITTTGTGDRSPPTGVFLLADATAGTHTATIVSEARCAGTKHALYSGGGFTFWGSVISFTFKAGTQPGSSYDASAYKGVTFYARAKQTVTGRVKFPDKNTASWGGVCQGSAQCDDHWGRNVEFGTTWKRYTLNFNALDQLRPNLFGPFLASNTSGIELVVNRAQTFDIEIDDIAFIK